MLYLFYRIIVLQTFSTIYCLHLQTKQSQVDQYSGNSSELNHFLDNVLKAKSDLQWIQRVAAKQQDNTKRSRFDRNSKQNFELDLARANFNQRYNFNQLNNDEQKFQSKSHGLVAERSIKKDMTQQLKSFMKSGTPISESFDQRDDNFGSHSRYQRNLVHDYDNGMNGMIPVRGVDRGKPDESYFGNSKQESPRQNLVKRESTEENYEENDDEESYDDDNDDQEENEHDLEKKEVNQDEDNEEYYEESYEDPEMENDENLREDLEAELHHKSRSPVKVPIKNLANHTPSEQILDQELLQRIQEDASLILTNFTNNLKSFHRQLLPVNNQIKTRNPSSNESQLITLIKLNQDIISNLKRISKDPLKTQSKRDSEKIMHTYNTQAFSNPIMNKIRNIDNEVILKKGPDKALQEDKDDHVEKDTKEHTALRCADIIPNVTVDSCGKIKVNPRPPCKDVTDEVDKKIWQLLNETLKSSPLRSSNFHNPIRSPLQEPCSATTPKIIEFKCHNKCLQYPNRMTYPYHEATEPNFNEDNLKTVMKRSHNEPNIPESFQTNRDPSVKSEDTQLEKSIAKLMKKGSEKESKKSDDSFRTDENSVEEKSKVTWNIANFVGDFLRNNEVPDSLLKDPKFFNLWDSKEETKESILNTPVAKLNSLVQLDKLISETATISTVSDGGATMKKHRFSNNQGFGNKLTRYESISDIERRYHPSGTKSYLPASHPRAVSNIQESVNFNTQANRDRGPAQIIPNTINQNVDSNPSLEPSNLTNRIFHPPTIMGPPISQSTTASSLSLQPKLISKDQTINKEPTSEVKAPTSHYFKPSIISKEPNQISKETTSPDKHNQDSIKFRKALMEHAKKNVRYLKSSNLKKSIPIYSNVPKTSFNLNQNVVTLKSKLHHKPNLLGKDSNFEGSNDLETDLIASLKEPEILNRFTVVNDSQGTFYKLKDDSLVGYDLVPDSTNKLDSGKSDLVNRSPVFLSNRFSKQFGNISEYNDRNSSGANFKTITFNKNKNPTNFQIQLKVTPDLNEGLLDKISEEPEFYEPEIDSNDYEENAYDSSNYIRSRQLKSIEETASLNGTNSTEAPSKNATEELLNNTLVRPKRDIGHFLGMDEDENYHDEATNEDSSSSDNNEDVYDDKNENQDSQVKAAESFASDVDEETPLKRIKHHNKHKVFYHNPRKKKTHWDMHDASALNEEPKHRLNRVLRHDKLNKDALNKERLKDIQRKTSELLHSKEFTDESELAMLRQLQKINEELNSNAAGEFNPRADTNVNLVQKTAFSKAAFSKIPEVDLGKKMQTVEKVDLSKNEKRVKKNVSPVNFEPKKVLQKRDLQGSNQSSAKRLREQVAIHKPFFLSKNRNKRRQHHLLLKHRNGHSQNAFKNHFRKRKSQRKRFKDVNLIQSLFDYNEMQPKYGQQRFVRESSSDKSHAKKEGELEKPHLGDTLTGDVKVKSYTEEHQLEEAMTGQLAHVIVESIFHHVEKSNKLKFAVGPGLFREKKKHNDSSVMHADDTLKAIQTNEKMLHDVLVMLNTVVEEQIKIRTCIRLNHDKHCFLGWLTSHMTASCASYSPFGKIEVATPKPPTLTTHSQSNLNRNFNPFEVNIPDKTAISNEEIRQRIETIEELLNEYNALSSKEKSKVKSIHKILTKHLELLLKLQKSKEDLELEDIGNSLARPAIVLGYSNFFDTNEMRAKTRNLPNPALDAVEQNKLIEKDLELFGLGPQNASPFPPESTTIFIKNASHINEIPTSHRENIQRRNYGSEKYRKLVETAEYYRKKREIENQRKNQFERYKKELMKSHGIADDEVKSSEPEKTDNDLVKVGFEEPPVLSVS